jgi:hypothetical protein
MLMNQSSLNHKVGERSAQSNGVETSIFMATKAGRTADDARGCDWMGSLPSADDLFQSSKLELEQYESHLPALLLARLPHRLTGQLLAAESNRQRLSLV